MVMIVMLICATIVAAILYGVGQLESAELEGLREIKPQLVTFPALPISPEDEAIVNELMRRRTDDLLIRRYVPLGNENAYGAGATPVPNLREYAPTGDDEPPTLRTGHVPAQYQVDPGGAE